MVQTLQWIFIPLSSSNFSARADVPLIINFSKRARTATTTKVAFRRETSYDDPGPTRNIVRSSGDSGVNVYVVSAGFEELGVVSDWRPPPPPPPPCMIYNRTAQEVGVLACFPSVEYCNRPSLYTIIQHIYLYIVRLPYTPRPRPRPRPRLPGE